MVAGSWSGARYWQRKTHPHLRMTVIHIKHVAGRVKRPVTPGKSNRGNLQHCLAQSAAVINCFEIIE